MSKKTPVRRKAKAPKASASVEHIKDLVPDPKNARVHNPRNIGTIADGLRKIGAARSIVIDENDVVLAGNGVVEAAAEAGITKVRVVEANGNEIIAVRRRGLSPKQKAELAVYDNRAAEMAPGWDEEMLQVLQKDGLDLSALWSESELATLLAGGTRTVEFEAGPPSTGEFRVLVDCRDKRHQKELLARFRAEHLACRAVTGEP